MKLATLAILATALASGTAAHAKEPIPPYKYALTQESAHECGVIQLILSDAKEATDPLWSRQHGAMSFTWFTVAGLLGDEIPEDEQTRLTEAVVAKFPEGKLSVEAATELAKPCEVMTSLHRETYNFAANLAKEEEPELFADDAAFKRQIGGEYPDAPTKELVFNDWLFFAKGNLCFAASTKTEKGQFTLGFINFFDGSLRLEGDNLPELTEENYETEMPKHQAGIGWSKEEDVFLPVLDEGVTYETFKGSAIFIDKQPIAMLNGDYLTMGKKYIFGAHIQRPYFNLMPVGQEMTVKILGEETHRFPTNTALWNEIGECMAQYPFG